MIFQLKRESGKKTEKPFIQNATVFFIDLAKCPLPNGMLSRFQIKAATAKALEFQKEFEAEAAGIILPKK